MLFFERLSRCAKQINTIGAGCLAPASAARFNRAEWIVRAVENLDEVQRRVIVTVGFTNCIAVARGIDVARRDGLVRKRLPFLFPKVGIIIGVGR